MLAISSSASISVTKAVAVPRGNICFEHANKVSIATEHVLCGEMEEQTYSASPQMP